MNNTQFERAYKRQQVIINSALKGQQSIRPNESGYTSSQREAYDKYQGFIERATKKMAELLESRKSLA